MEYNAYVIKAAGRGGHRRLTVLGNEGGSVRFSRDKRDTRSWVSQHSSCWARPATKKERVALLVNADGAILHRVRHLQWSAHRLWEQRRDFIAALRLIGAYCANWPIAEALSPDDLVNSLNDVKPWAWRPVGFAGAANLLEAVALLDREIARYKGLNDEEAEEEYRQLLHEDDEWVAVNNHTHLSEAHANALAERGMWETRLRRRLMLAVRPSM